jgi:hypothetical protein
MSEAAGYILRIAGEEWVDHVFKRLVVKSPAQFPFFSMVANGFICKVAKTANVIKELNEHIRDQEDLKFFRKRE